MLPTVLVLASFGPSADCAATGFLAALASAVSPAGGNGAGAIRAGADFGFVIGDPGADFDFHHFALAVALRRVEIEDGVQQVGSLLVVVEHEVSAHGGDRDGESDPQTPACDIDFVNGLVADFTVAGVPDPMPIVVKAIAREGFHGSGAGPEFVIDASRNGFLRSVADRRAPLVTERAGHVDIADGAVAQMMNGFEHAGVRARLAAVLANAVVLFYGSDELAAFKGVMRAGLFDVDVFAGLAGPDAHERVPMIGSGDGDGIDVFVFEQLANVDVGFWLRQAHLFDFARCAGWRRFRRCRRWRRFLLQGHAKSRECDRCRGRALRRWLRGHVRWRREFCRRARA